MLKRSSLLYPLFRPALPADRWQIRRLLESYDRTRSKSLGWQAGQHFGVGILLGLWLHAVVVLGGMLLALYGLLVLGTILGCVWLNLSLFSDWQNYWVIEQNAHLIACCKLTSYRGYAVLSDVVVLPEQRQRGIGSQLVQSTVRRSQQLIYLACLPERISFYQRLGFDPVSPALLSTQLKRLLGLDQQPALRVLLRVSLRGE